MVVRGGIPYTPVAIPIQFIKSRQPRVHDHETLRNATTTDLGSPSHYSVHGAAEEKKETTY
jgi:hypothetical protein